jgi:hypothetical protein
VAPCHVYDPGGGADGRELEVELSNEQGVALAGILEHVLNAYTLWPPRTLA